MYAWGWFDIKVVIEWKDFTGLGTMNLVHSLAFNDSYYEKTQYLEINQPEKPKAKPAAPVKKPVQAAAA